MTTLESPVVRELFNRVHAVDKGIRYGGSVPNLATELRHSYHRSWDDSPHDGGYSVHYLGDRIGLNGHVKHVAGLHYPSGLPNQPRDFASAIDFTMDTDRMEKYTRRMIAWAKAGKPKVHAFGRVVTIDNVREFAGTIDGHVVYAMDTTGKYGKRTYGWDNSHLWHIHMSINRRGILSANTLSIAAFFAHDFALAR